MVVDLSLPRRQIIKAIDRLDEVILKAKMQGHEINDYQITIAASFALGLAFCSNPAYAATDVNQRIWNAFKPLIDLIRGLGKPVVYLVETAGVLTMFFDKRKGLKMMKDGAIAYLVLHFLPIFLGLLEEVGKAIENGR